MSTTSTPYVDAAYEHARGHQNKYRHRPAFGPYSLPKWRSSKTPRAQGTAQHRGKQAHTDTNGMFN
jgi:hypothetical protein